MLIVCPSCARRYLLDQDTVGPNGRTVRCASCRTPFFAAAPDVADDSAPTDPAFDADALRASINDDDSLESRRAPRNLDSDGIDSERGTDDTTIDAFALSAPADLVAPANAGLASGRLGQIGRRVAGIGRQSRVPPAMARNLARFVAPAMVGLCLIITVGAIVKREAVVRVAPQTARLFAAIKMPVNLRGLVFENVRSETVREDDARLLVVEGEIANVAGRTVPVPAIVLHVRSADGETLYTWTAEPERAELPDGERMAFRARLASPPNDGQNVLLAFVKDGDAAMANSSPR